MTPDEKFTLQNDQLRPKPLQLGNNDKSRQKVLFSGLDCLPGQLDLFPTDGTNQGERNATPDQDAERHV